jgi:hypothetical protein
MSDEIFMGNININVIEQGVELLIESDDGVLLKTTIDPVMAHHLAIALLKVPTHDDGDINAVPFLVCKDPKSLAIGATSDADLSITFGPNDMRPLQFILSNDERVGRVMELMAEVLRTPRQMRFQDNKH